MSSGAKVQYMSPEVQLPRRASLDVMQKLNNALAGPTPGPGAGGRRRSIQPPSMRISDTGDAEVLAMLSGEAEPSAYMTENDIKEMLRDIQRAAPFFHGFTDEEIDAIYPFLTHFPFEDGDLLAAQGEDASWVGIVLKGKLDAMTEEGKVLGSVEPGRIVGEMSLFRGGMRFCDLVGHGKGELVAILFSDLPDMYASAPHVAHKLIMAFGKAATAKLVFSHPLPSSAALANSHSAPAASPTKRLAVRHKLAVGALVKRGLSEAEAERLMKLMVIEPFTPMQACAARAIHMPPLAHPCAPLFVLPHLPLRLHPAEPARGRSRGRHLFARMRPLFALCPRSPAGLLRACAPPHEGRRVGGDGARTGGDPGGTSSPAYHHRARGRRARK